MDANLKLIDALRQIEAEKGLSLETVLDALSDALASAYRKKYQVMTPAKVEINRETGEIKVFECKEMENGEIEEVEVTPENFGRVAAQTAKQVILQRIREAERDLMFDEYHGREGDIVTGIIQQSDHRYTLLDLGKTEALLPPDEQVKGERYERGMRLKTYIVEVRKTTKGPQIIVSRSHPGLLKRLFELEVPEIYDGLVEIKAVAREAGQRSKVAVVSKDSNVDPVGACVGSKGSRVRIIVNELRGEKIDIVEWKEDPAEFIANAISPARAKQVLVDNETMTAEILVPDNHLSLAIGKEGQNVRLAAKLTGWKIDILSESRAKEAEVGGAAAEQEIQDRQCRAITASGQRCRNKAKPGSDFCGMPAHRKLSEMIASGDFQVEEYEPEEETPKESFPMQKEDNDTCGGESKKQENMKLPTEADTNDAFPDGEKPVENSPED
ncbi:MAG: transcription termination factor NusA [Actinomycetota bacterium]|nr:transcription termination factor NusA [Actinomycetota bacterium]